jgi:hypothetical protein
MWWGGEGSGEKSRFHPAPFASGFESLLAAGGLISCEQG